MPRKGFPKAKRQQKVKIPEFHTFAKLLPPTVGPILGEATHDHLRIMIRGANLSDETICKETEHLETGVCQLSFNREFTQGVQTRIFKLNKDYDYTGVAIFSQLIADKKYFYRIGFAKGHQNDFKTKELDWSKIAVDHVHIHPDTKSNQPVSFYLGSCRYVMHKGDAWSFDDSSDKIFGTALEKLTFDNKQVEFSLFCGDQIYADDLNDISQRNSISDYQLKYRHVFSTPNFKALARRIPSYMILDDHDIWDDYPDTSHIQNGFLSPDTLRKSRVNGHRFFQAYQLSHSPKYEVKHLESPPSSSYNSNLGRLACEKLINTPKNYWYDFDCGCLDVFVMDARTERIINSEKRCGIMYRKQIEAFEAWLEKDKDTRVKAVVVSVPLFPDYKDGTDQWGDERWRWQRDSVLEIIRKAKVKRLMFLSGDVHSSFVSKLTHVSEDVKLYQVISSPLYWPHFTGQGDIDDYNIDGPMSGNDNWHISTRPIEKNHCKICQTQAHAGKKSPQSIRCNNECNFFTKDDNICKIDVDLDGFGVKAFSRKGDILSDRYFKF